MRKTITLFATLALLLFLLFPGSALASPNSTTVVFPIGSTTYTVNGQTQAMDTATGVIQET